MKLLSMTLLSRFRSGFLCSSRLLLRGGWLFLRGRLLHHLLSPRLLSCRFLSRGFLSLGSGLLLGYLLLDYLLLHLLHHLFLDYLLFRGGLLRLGAKLVRALHLYGDFNTSGEGAERRKKKKDHRHEARDILIALLNVGEEGAEGQKKNKEGSTQSERRRRGKE